MSRIEVGLLVGCLVGLATGCGDDSSGGTDGGRIVQDGGGVGTDSGGGALDSGGGDLDSGGGSTDSGAVALDAGSCSPAMDACPAGTMCLCCPAGGPASHCLCTTRCMADRECTDLARPRCDKPGTPPGGMGQCMPQDLMCAWFSVCASPDTPVATPDGERAIASLAPGDLVYSDDGDALVPVPLLRVSHTLVTGHHVMRVRLANGRELELSAGHPTADGRTFGELRAGERLDGVLVLSVERIPYTHESTFDILPASSTHTYVAAGVLVGSTLADP